LPDFLANRGFDLQLAAWLQTEGNFIAHRAGNPPCLGNPGDSGKTHARRAADDIQYRRHRLYAGDRRNILGKTIPHEVRPSPEDNDCFILCHLSLSILRDRDGGQARVLKA
jgi:hypothetical protein